MADSIVEYFGGDSEGHRCGYCKSPNTNFSHGNLIEVTGRKCVHFLFIEKNLTSTVLQCAVHM